MSRHVPSVDHLLDLSLSALARQTSGIMLCTEDRVVFMNPSLLALLGLSDGPGRPEGQTIRQFLSMASPAFADPAGFLAMAEDSLAGKCRSNDTPLPLADGRLLHVDIIPMAGHGRPGDWMLQLRDVTELKRTEATLKENCEKFQGFIATLYDWVWEVDCEGRYTYSSPQIKPILGYTPEEVMGRRPFDLMPSGEAGRIADQFTALIARRQPLVSLENRNLHKDGHEVVLETSGLPFYDDAGNLKGYRGIDRDITASKRIEQELIRSREKFSKAFQTSPYAIAMTNLKTGVFQDVNDAFVALAGYSREEVIGQSVLRLNIWVREQDRNEVMHDLLAGRPVVGREFQFRNKNGQIGTGLFSAQTIDLAEGPCILSSIENITVRKQAETEREKLIEELRKALAEIKTLKGIVPICSSCKKIRDDHGYWEMVEAYISKHTDAQFTHGICPECMEKLYPEYSKDKRHPL